MTKKILTILILMITLVSLLSGCTQQEKPPEDNNNNTPPINGNNTLYVGGTDADYSTIQEAIHAAKNGATIIISKGVYNELIDINKTLTLIGEDRNTTIINFNPSYPISQVPVININAHNCTIENLQITLGNKAVIAQGISVTTKNNTIKNTIITNVTTAIDLLSYSDSNTIINNEIKNNLIGINGLSSTHNNISHNTFSNNNQYNIYLSTSSNDNNVSFNTMTNATYGIRIKGSKDNMVYKNCITHANIGLYCCCGASHNYFSNNTLINNSDNAEENAGLQNIWYIGSIGNYWDDYNGSDENHDGIGDTPYDIPKAGNQDMYPLMTPPLDAPCNQ
jgi:parallel beta-helix repeat protein